MNLSQDEEGDYSVSLSKFELMLKTNKILFFDSEEFETIIIHYLDAGKNALAKKALKLALDQHPYVTGLRIIQIEMLIYENKFDIAERMLDELYTIEPTNEEIYIQKANIFSKKDNHEKAVEFLKIALQYTDNCADVYSLIAMEYLFMEKLELAKENFIKALHEDSSDHFNLYHAVYCFDFLEQNAEAIVFLNKIIDKSPYNEIAWHQLGKQYYAINDYLNALRAFDYASLIDEEFLGAFLEKAKSLERLGRYKEAIENYNITNGLGDPNSFVLLRTGKCYQKMGNMKLALQYYNKTVHEDPLLDKGWIAIADLYSHQKNYHKALYYINKALNIDDQNVSYWKRYATIHSLMHLFEESEYGYRKMIESGDRDVINWLLWIDTLQYLGEFQKAIESLLLAKEHFENNSDIEYRLAGLYYMEHDSKKGNLCLVKGLNLNYNNHKIVENLFPSVWLNKEVQSYIKDYYNKK